MPSGPPVRARGPGGGFNQQPPAKAKPKRGAVQLEEESISQINGRQGIANGNQRRVCANCVSWYIRYNMKLEGAECKITCPTRLAQAPSTQPEYWDTDLPLSQRGGPPGSSQVRHNFGSQSQANGGMDVDSQGF